MEYKEFNLSHLNQVINLLNICFPNKKITANSFLWKHYDKYFNNKSTAMIAVDKNKICAFVCFTPIFIANNNYQNFYSCAVQASHPEYRRKGIISDLTQIIEKKLGDYVEYIGFSNNDGVKIDKFSKKIGYQILGQINTRYVLSLPYKSSFDVIQVDKIFPKTNWQLNYFSVLKNIDYLKWRYEKNPKNKFEYFEIRNQNIIIGYIICKKNRIKYEVYDLLLNNDNIKLYGLIIKSFAKFAFFKKKFLVSYSYLPNNFWMKRFPFISVSKKIPLFLTIKTTKTDLTNINNWIIQSGDIQ